MLFWKSYFSYRSKKQINRNTENLESQLINLGDVYRTLQVTAEAYIYFQVHECDEINDKLSMNIMSQQIQLKSYVVICMC